MILLLGAGVPVAFALGALSTLVILFFLGTAKLSLLPSALFSMLFSLPTIAALQFILMAQILQGSGVAEDLFAFMRRLFGGVPGGLAIAVVAICTIIAAMSGVAAAGILTMGIIALPIMLKYGYDKSMAIGPVLAGGALGLLIPPSVSFVFYGALAQVSVGRLFAGGVIPGLILSVCYMSFIAIRCRFNPKLGPPVPVEDRVSIKEKIFNAKHLVLPVLLIVGVLGSMFAGVANATEASAVGAAGAVVCAAIHRKLNFQMIKDALVTTARFGGMIAWILVAGTLFRFAVMYTGIDTIITSFATKLPVAPLVIIMLMQIVYLILGCFMDEITMMFITFPVFLPIVRALGFDIIWFGVVFLVNVQVAYISPPFGFSLFYMKSVAPPQITMADIYKAIIPYIIIQIIILVVVMFFPVLSLWLPNLIYGIAGG